MRSRLSLFPLAFAVLVGCTQVLGIDGDYSLNDDEGAGGSGTGTGIGGSGTGTGIGGSGTGTGTGNCPAEPTPRGGSCPADCTGGCDSDTCVIDCGLSDCDNIDCPVGWPCRVDCSAGDCDFADITCPPDQACEVVCEGASNCEDATVDCGGGPCTLTCGTGSQVCRDAELNCGPHRCEASCSSPGNPPTVNCGDSCDCAGC